MIEVFTRLIIGAEFENIPDRLVRWEQPIRYQFIPDPDDHFRSEISQYMRRLSALSGLTIIEAEFRPIVPSDVDSETLLIRPLFNPGEKRSVISAKARPAWKGGTLDDEHLVLGLFRENGPENWGYADVNMVIFRQPRNLTIEFMKLQKMSPKLIEDLQTQTGLCAANVRMLTNIHEISHAFIFIPDDLTPENRRRCIHEEIAQALGASNDYKGAKETIFSDRFSHIVSDLTSWDEFMIRYMYDKETVPGISGTELRDSIRRFIRRNGGVPPLRYDTSTPAR
jgi:hypothetical protein